jgi:hypothetical protein
MISLRAATALAMSLPFVTSTGTIVCTNEVVDFNLIDTSVSSPIFTELTPVVDLSDFPTCKLNIEATVASVPSNCDERTVKCVKFFLDDVMIRKEKFAPYTYFGDIPGSVIKEGKPPLGTHTLKACTYSDKACTKHEMGCKEMSVEFLDCDRATNSPTDAPTNGPTVGPTDAPTNGTTDSPTERPTAAPIPTERDCSVENEVTGFELVDAESPYRPVISPFSPPIIDLLEFPTCALNIFANVRDNTCGGAPIKCVSLSLGGQYRKEVLEPYALYGNTGRFIRSGKPQLGAQTLRACTYTDDRCTEGESGCLEVDVFVKDCISMSM